MLFLQKMTFLLNICRNTFKQTFKSMRYILDKSYRWIYMEL